MRTNWIDVAQQLPVGGKTDIACPQDCGSGKKLSVNHTPKDYWCNCYRCGWTARQSKGKQTLAEIARIKELNEAAKEELPLELPDDYTTDIPLEGRLWLYKAGLSEPVWRKHGIGYSPLLQRVVLPVFDSAGNLIWLQCRAIHAGQLPKYLQPSRDRSEIVMEVGCTSDNMERVILTEDILSCIRVGRHCAAVSLLGTKLTTAQAAKLINHSRVTTWLDSDEAGRKGAASIRRTLGLVTEVDNIVTELDPKMLSDKQIIEELRK